MSAGEPINAYEIAKDLIGSGFIYISPPEASHFQPYKLPLKYKKLDPRAIAPTKAHSGDAGYDLYCLEEVDFVSGQIADVSTGIALEIPPGHVGLIWDRSSMGAKVFGGVIDAGYRGEIKLKLGFLKSNVDSGTYYGIKLLAGAKVAQILIQKVEDLPLEEVEELSETIRGDKGFGSTGV
jgi:deoxyuridine 5'-triphosphate nucleotidohydrolase